MVIGQQDRVPGGVWCTVGNDVFDPLISLDEVVPTDILRTLVSQSKFLVSDEHLERFSLISKFNGENIAVFFDPDVDVM